MGACLCVFLRTVLGFEIYVPDDYITQSTSEEVLALVGWFVELQRLYAKTQSGTILRGPFTVNTSLS